jgi:hypothetical protein
VRAGRFFSGRFSEFERGVLAQLREFWGRCFHMLPLGEGARAQEGFGRNDRLVYDLVPVAFYAGIVVSFLLLVYFMAGFWVEGEGHNKAG